MKIAVVGAGIAGLSSAWLLARAGHEVSLFEAQDYPGGHSNTVDVTLEGVTAPVDTGFLVHNDRTYPNLIRLFALLGVPVYQSEMTFSVSLEKENVEWAGSDLATLFAQKRNLLRPTFWRMVRDILRLHRLAPQMRQESKDSGETLGQILVRYGFSDTLRDWYLLPMGAAIWSSSTRDMADFPASTFFDFCANHGLMQILDRPQWKTVQGGSREYVRRMIAGIHDVRLSSAVTAVARDERGVTVHSRHGAEQFDRLVLACHSDQALALLTDASADERAVLSGLRYQPNRAILHTDTRFLPSRKKAWSAWNYRMGESGPSASPVMVTYLLNHLQDLPFKTPVMVTLNPYREPEGILAEFDYAHPLFDRTAIDAQQQLATIQGRLHTWFAGAWAGYGFHEDGLKAGVAVAQGLGAPIPWDLSQPVATHAVLPEWALA